MKESRVDQSPLTSLSERFSNICQRYSEKLAIISDEQTQTYQQLAERVQAWANLLKEQGVQSGMRVLISVSHRSDFPSLLLAHWQIGAVPVTLEPTVASDELARAMQEGRVHWLLSENETHSAALATDANRVHCSLQPAWLMASIPAYADELSPTDLSFFIYTSGTVGTPKCVVYDHTAAAAIIDSLIVAYEIASEDTVMTPLSPVLSATFITGILPALMSGATLVLPARPVPGAVLKLIAATRATIFFSVPYFYQLLIEAMKIRQQVDWSSVRLCLSTSAFLQGETFDAFYRVTRQPIRSIYCTSEANQCTFNTTGDITLLRNSVGQPQKGVQLRIVDEQYQDVLPGKEGQIIVSGTHLSRGYFHRSDLEEQTYRAGWVYTGDLGVCDEQGNLYITGRLSATINVSGHLVNPQEVEQILRTHPIVEEALVLGEGDTLIGEHVVAWVVVKPGEQADAAALLRHCKEGLIHYKAPQRIEFVPALPKGRYGKIRRLVPSIEKSLSSTEH